MKVLSFGEILWDIIEGKPYIGGAPFNFAAHMAQCGADVSMISRLGKDELGKRAVEEVKKLSVGDAYIQWDEKHPTGTVDVILRQGQPSYTINRPVAYDFIDFEELETKGLTENPFDIFAFGTLAQRNETSQAALQWILKRKKFSEVFYDVNLRKDCYTKKLIKDSLPHSSMLKLNDDEVVILSGFLYKQALEIGEFCEKLITDYPLNIIIITEGAKGCSVFHENTLYFVPSQKVKVADTVGAGDSFSAAFLYTYFRYKDPVKAAAVANRVGGFVASNHGPIPMYTEEIRGLLKE